MTRPRPRHSACWGRLQQPERGPIEHEGDGRVPVFLFASNVLVQATSGCTSASLADSKNLVGWLNAEFNLMIVELPKRNLGS